MSDRAPRGTDGTSYEITVKGRLAPRWATRFDGLTLRPADDGTTVLVGRIADQAALHGVLRTLADLGLPLVSVSPSRPGPDPHRSGSDAADRATQKEQHT